MTDPFPNTNVQRGWNGFGPAAELTLSVQVLPQKITICRCLSPHIVETPTWRLSRGFPRLRPVQFQQLERAKIQAIGMPKRFARRPDDCAHRQAPLLSLGIRASRSHFARFLFLDPRYSLPPVQLVKHFMDRNVVGFKENKQVEQGICGF